MSSIVMKKLRLLNIARTDNFFASAMLTSWSKFGHADDATADADENNKVI